MKFTPPAVRKLFALGILLLGGLGIFGAWNVVSLVESITRLVPIEATTAPQIGQAQNELPPVDHEQQQRAIQRLYDQAWRIVVVLLAGSPIIVGLLMTANWLVDHELALRQITDKRLREREARLQTILDSEPECVKLVAEDGRLLEMNAAGLQMIEAGSASQVIGHQVEELVAPEFRREFQLLNQRVFRGESCTLEYELIGLKGGRRWIETHAAPLRDEYGQVTAQLGITRDITARKQAEAALCASEERLRLTLENARHGLWDWDITMGRSQLDDMWYAILGYADGERPPGYELWEQSIHPEDKSQVMEVLQRHLDSGDALFDVDYRARKKSGEWIWINSRGRVHQRDAGGKPLRMMGTIHDITARKQAEAALQKSEAMLELVLDSIPQGVFWKDRQSVYLGANRVCRLAMGVMESQSVVGMTDFDVPNFRPAQAEFFVSKDREVMDSDQPQFAIEEFLTLPNGSTIWLETNKMPMHDGSGNVSGVLGTWENITERKLANEGLRASHERLTSLSRQLLAAQESERRQVARELHDEIGQVLTAISLKLHHLKSVCGPEANSELDAGLELIGQALSQVRNLSLNLRPPMLDLLGLDAAVRSCVEQHRQHTGCDVQLEIQLDSRLSPELEITCYRVIQSALTNIARHAQASQISVELREHNLGLELVVNDNGIGLDVNKVRQRSGLGECFGILAMEERVKSLGGSFRIDSAKTAGTGTSIRAHFSLVTTVASRSDIQ